MLYHFLDDDVTFKSNVMTTARNSLIFYKLLTAGRQDDKVWSHVYVRVLGNTNLQ